MWVTAELFPARETRTVDLSEDADGYELMKRLGLAPDVHILVRDEVPIPIDERLRAGERLRVIAVVSGGRSASRRGPKRSSSASGAGRLSDPRRRRTSTAPR